MTVPLRYLIEEWEVVNAELYRASLESHRRYPFPANSGVCSDSTYCAAEDTSPPDPPLSSTSTYARVYSLLSRVRHVAEDARYNSFFIMQNLLWVTIVAWANHLVNASRNLIRLPMNMRQYHETPSSNTTRGADVHHVIDHDGTANDSAPGAYTPVHRISFPCNLLPDLEFWDPSVLGEAGLASSRTPGEHNVSVHRAPNLPEVWSNAVKRIFELWCSTPTDNSLAKPAQPNNTRSVPDDAAPTVTHYTHVWVTVAQHFHRFKSLLSLFFLRYDALLEEEEEQLHWRSHRQLQQARTNLSRTLHRRGEPLPVSSSSISSGVPATAAATEEGGSNSFSAPRTLSTDKETTTKTKRSVSSPLDPLNFPPNTVNLLGYLMRCIANENIRSIHEVANQAFFSLLLPRVHRDRLRHQNTLPTCGAGDSQPLSCDVPLQTNAMPNEPNHEKKVLRSPISTQRLAETFCGHSGERTGGGDDDDNDDDDRVVWSSPPSPLISYAAKPCEEKYHNTPAQDIKLDTTLPIHRAEEGVKREEYVMRNFFKLLLMIEDCRANLLHRRILENSKHVASLCGSQLAANLSDDNAAVQPITSILCPVSSGVSNETAAKPRSLADANRVLRDVLQAYLRLRAKLLFLNAGTTHFLDALSPWGRTRMLESLNAFLCGFCTVTWIDQAESQTAALLPGSKKSSMRSIAVNPAVAEFTRKWSVPLWVAMCDDAKRCKEALKREEENRGQRIRYREPLVEKTFQRATQSVKYHQQLQKIPSTETCSEEERGASDHWNHGRCNPGPTSATLMSSQTAGAGGAVDDGNAHTLVLCDRHSVLSTELEDAVSRTTSVIWPPRSPTVAHDCARISEGHNMCYSGGVEGVSRPLTRRRGRGLDLKCILLQEHQRCARLGCVQLPRRGVTASRNGTLVLGRNNGCGDAVESLYTGETTSLDEDDSVFAVQAEIEDDGTNVDLARQVTNPTATREWQRTDGPCRPSAATPPAKCFSLSAQLHQMATLPDEGFPSLLYLLPRRNRCIRQDRTAAAVQRQLFRMFSDKVEAYLNDRLAECEDVTAAAAAGHCTSLVSQKKRDKNAQTTEISENQDNKTPSASPTDAVTPLPESFLARMTLLLEMTYAALQGHSGSDEKKPNDQGQGNHLHKKRASRLPLMETGLTATGQELGGPIIEQSNGEFHKLVFTTLSVPTPPAQLTIAAVRKAFRGFLTSVEKRAVLTLAQALYRLVQQGAAQQPPAVHLDSVDTILNMASMLNAKETFVLLVKGYLAPQVMMCRSSAELVVELQVVNRMSYRLGATVAAPCLALLRDLQLAIADPRTTTHSLPTSGTPMPTCPWVDGKPNARNENFIRKSSVGNWGDLRRTINKERTPEHVPPLSTQEAETPLAVNHQHHGSFGLINRVHILCQAWWKPHTAMLVSSHRLRELWELHQLLDERMINAVLSVEWRYEGNLEEFCGYGSLAKLGRKKEKDVSEASEALFSTHGSGGDLSSTLAVSTHLRTVSAAAVVRGFSSALGNAVRRTGRQAGDFGYSDSENESEDYREAYGGLLTLSTLQQHRSSHTPSNSSYRGSNLSSIGGPALGASGGAGGEHWGTSDGRQSTFTDDRTSTVVPAGGQLEPRRLRWSLGDGQLTFYLFPRATVSTDHRVSKAVQILGPPLTLIVCQLLDRADDGQLYTFNALHKALPIPASKTLLAHLLHELVKAKIVVRSVAVGTRKLTYRLCDSTHEVHQRKVVVDISTVAQQQWVKRTVDRVVSNESHDADEDSTGKGNARNFASPTNPEKAENVFPVQPRRGVQQARLSDATEAKVSLNMRTNDRSPRSYISDCSRKIEVCIVRLMKSERVLSHRDLLERVALALEGQMTVTQGQFKRCIAHLIEKELIQRGERDEYLFLS